MAAVINVFVRIMDYCFFILRVSSAEQRLVESRVHSTRNEVTEIRLDPKVWLLNFVRLVKVILSIDELLELVLVIIIVVDR